MDFTLRRKSSETLSLTVTKFIGFLATIASIVGFYSLFKYYRGNDFNSYFTYLELFTPLFVLSAPAYFWFTTKFMTEPKDGYWLIGRLLLFKPEKFDAEVLLDHFRGWFIKAFFLAFMVMVIPSTLNSIVSLDASAIFEQPQFIFIFLINFLFLFDICFGAIGYVLTLRVLDSHIRSANPFVSGWVAALICYPPFVVMSSDGVLNYRSGGQLWHVWFEGNTVLLILWGTILTILTFFYAWSTVIFGVRFSNLTHRGIITNGPYSMFKHPAYLSKGLFWWLLYLPFLSLEGADTAIRNTILLSIVCAIYLWRAKTEERHLMADPTYRQYSEWIGEHGVIPKCKRVLLSRFAGLA